MGPYSRAPTERDALNLKHLSVRAVAFDDCIFLGTVAARGAVDEQVPLLETVAAAPGQACEVVS